MQIEVKNLAFSYGTRPILTIDIVTFAAGKIYGIVGRNGVGKTTFFKTLTNIITKYQGTITYDGQEVKSNPSVLQHVGIMLDDMELYRARTGWFNIRYFGGLRGGVDETKAQEIATALGIDKALAQKVSTYSLGMRKKLVMLISLMNDADVMIFDEPFRGIDVAAVQWLNQHFKQLRDAGKTILVSSHVQADLADLADWVYALVNGNFSQRFNLTDQEQQRTYRVRVNNQDQLLDLLEAAKIESQVTEQGVIIFKTSAPQFDQLFKQAVADGVTFSAIDSQNQFADAMH